jgi:hypothetical protein
VTEIQPFISNHQYNLIRRQAERLLQARKTVTDPKVVEAVCCSVLLAIAEEFPAATESHKQALDAVSAVTTAGELQVYLQSLQPYMAAFPQLTDKALKKLFPKVKKLRGPNLEALDRRYVTYIGWADIAMNKMFLVYDLLGQLVGIEGNLTPVGKKSVCFVCNRYEEVALVSAVTKSRPAHASPDYYKSVGNYMCVDSSVCNRNITNVAALEKFVQAVLGIPSATK